MGSTIVKYWAINYLKYTCPFSSHFAMRPQSGGARSVSCINTACACTLTWDEKTHMHQKAGAEKMSLRAPQEGNNIMTYSHGRQIDLITDAPCGIGARGIDCLSINFTNGWTKLYTYAHTQPRCVD